MLYTLGDFIENLKRQELDQADIQSDEALEAINECLPRNLLIARLPELGDCPKKGVVDELIGDTTYPKPLHEYEKGSL